MKKALIIVGSHHAGKSRTINRHLKSALGISAKANKFSEKDLYGTGSANKSYGWIYSQSIEERGRKTPWIAEFASNSKWQRLVFSARPIGEPVSHYKTLKEELEKAGYKVETIDIVKTLGTDGMYDDKCYYKAKGAEALQALR